MRSSIILAGLIWAISANASAQDGSEGSANRTLAGAVKFFDTVAKRTLLPLGGYFSEQVTVTAAVTSVVAESDCITRLDGSYDFWGAGVHGTFGKVEDAEKEEKFLAATGVTRPPFRVDWGKVVDLERTGRAIPYSSSTTEAKISVSMV